MIDFNLQCAQLSLSQSFKTTIRGDLLLSMIDRWGGLAHKGPGRGRMQRLR